MQQEMLRALNHPRTIMEFLPNPPSPAPSFHSTVCSFVICGAGSSSSSAFTCRGHALDLSRGEHGDCQWRCGIGGGEGGDGVDKGKLDAYL